MVAYSALEVIRPTSCCINFVREMYNGLGILGSKWPPVEANGKGSFDRE